MPRFFFEIKIRQSTGKSPEVSKERAKSLRIIRHDLSQPPEK
jgi:hypothetical protein